MDFKDIKCPSCGATNVEHLGGGHFSCPYCGNEFEVKDSYFAETDIVKGKGVKVTKKEEKLWPKLLVCFILLALLYWVMSGRDSYRDYCRLRDSFAFQSEQEVRDFLMAKPFTSDYDTLQFIKNADYLVYKHRGEDSICTKIRIKFCPKDEDSFIRIMGKDNKEYRSAFQALIYTEEHIHYIHNIVGVFTRDGTTGDIRADESFNLLCRNYYPDKPGVKCRYCGEIFYNYSLYSVKWDKCTYCNKKQ